jgi:hypothetical protein
VFLFVVGHSFDSVVFRQAFLPFPVASPLTDRDATVHQFPNLSMTADIHSSPYVYWVHSITDETVVAAGDYITTSGPCSKKVVPSQRTSVGSGQDEIDAFRPSGFAGIAAGFRQCRNKTLRVGRQRGGHIP